MTEANDRPPPLDFEPWATLSALEDDELRDKRFSKLGVQASWQQVDSYWSEKLAHDLLTLQMERPRRYAAACARARQRSTTAIGGVVASSVPASAQTIMPAGLAGAPASADGAANASDAAVAAAASADISQSLSSDSVDATHRMERIEVGPAEPGVGENPAQTNFAAAMGANAAAPEVPAPGQQHTAYRLGGKEMTGELRAAEAASQWTVEQYACFCAELERAAERGEEVFQRYGLLSPTSREIVGETWTQRLAEDNALRARFDAMLNEQRAHSN